MDLTPTQIAGAGLIAFSVALFGWKTIAGMGSIFEQSTKPKNTVPTLASYQVAITTQQKAYESALARIHKLETELDAIRKVVGVSPADEVVV